MNPIETIILKKIEDIDPNLNVLGPDRKVLQVACQDFINYLKFHWNLTGKNMNFSYIAEEVDQFSNSQPKEFESFLTVWTGMWLKKWKSRVKLVFGNLNHNSSSKKHETVSNTESIWEIPRFTEEMIEIITNTLIKNAEICGTELIAKNIIKKELKKNNKKGINTKEQILSILNNSLHKAREVAQSKGPLIFARIGKEYYSAAST